MNYREDEDHRIIVQTNTGIGGAFVDCLKFEGQDRDTEARKAAEFLLGQEGAWQPAMRERIVRVVKRPGWVLIYHRDHDQEAYRLIGTASLEIGLVSVKEINHGKKNNELPC